MGVGWGFGTLQKQGTGSPAPAHRGAGSWQELKSKTVKVQGKGGRQGHAGPSLISPPTSPQLTLLQGTFNSSQLETLYAWEEPQATCF